MQRGIRSLSTRLMLLFVAVVGAFEVSLWLIFWYLLKHDTTRDVSVAGEATTDLPEKLAALLFSILVVATLAMWWTVRRALRSVNRIARQVREISEAPSGRRLSTPPTEGELGPIVEVVNDMLARLERDSENQRRFIAEVSHELKTPLAVVLGEAQALQRREFDQTQFADFLTGAVEELRQLLRTVKGFLVLARTQPGKRLSVTRAVSMEDIVTKAIRRCQNETGRQGARVVPQFDSAEAATEPFVDGDDELLESMAENLIRNAVRHWPPRERVSVRLFATVNEVELEVRGDGLAAPPDELVRVFDTNNQGSSSIARRGDSGIGMAIVKAVAEIHGGAVFVRNGRKGDGAFVVRLPVSTRRPLVPSNEANREQIRDVDKR